MPERETKRQHQPLTLKEAPGGPGLPYRHICIFKDALSGGVSQTCGSMDSFIPENGIGQVGGIVKPGDTAQHVPKWDLFGKFYSKRDHEFGALECPTAAVLTQI